MKSNINTIIHVYNIWDSEYFINENYWKMYLKHGWTFSEQN